MTCDEVRELLAEHLLGTLEVAADEAVRRHLRGCAGCRTELAALAEGVGTFAVAAHDVSPPAAARDRVLAVLRDEWEDVPEVRSTARPTRRRAIALAAILAASLAWGGVATLVAMRADRAAEKYESFLRVLGGEDVRVGELRPSGPRELRGSVVIYDSRVGQSWVLVLCRAPGREGTANVTMLAADGTAIDLHPVEFGPGGEASTWLVTASDLTPYDRVNLWDDSGVIASARLLRG